MSRLKDDWFYVTNNDDDEGTEVTTSEIRSMLANRIV